MIGHYLLTLTPEQEERVLTRRMAPGSYTAAMEYLGPCLIGTACDAPKVFDGSRAWYMAAPRAWRDNTPTVEDRYDVLCWRFGTAKINRLIRDRILANQLRRSLAGQREALPA